MRIDCAIVEVFRRPEILEVAGKKKEILAVFALLRLF